MSYPAAHDSVDSALLAILPPHLLDAGRLPRVPARLAVRTAVELGILAPLAQGARAEDVDAEIRALVAEDLDRALIFAGRAERFDDLPRGEQAALVNSRFEASPVRHLYEYLRTAAMIGHLAAPVGADDFVAIDNAA